MISLYKSNVTVVEREDRSLLLAQCYEHITKALMPELPDDRSLLEDIIELTPGASMRQIRYEHISHPMDFGDERYDFVLEVTYANVIALKAAGFEWTQEALSLTKSFVISDESIANTRKAAIARVRSKQREELKDLSIILRQTRSIKSMRKWCELWKKVWASDTCQLVDALLSRMAKEYFWYKYFK